MTSPSTPLPPDPLQQHLADELHAFTQAPVLFVASVLLAAAAIYWLVSRVMEARYAGRVSALEALVELKDERIRDYMGKLQGATPDEAKARLDRLEQAIQEQRLRNLTDEQKRLMIRALSDHLGALYMIYDSNCVNGRTFLAAIREASELAGWKVQETETTEGDWPAEGLGVRFAGHDLTPTQAAVTSALSAAGLLYDVKLGTAVRPGFDAELVICERTIPFLKPQLSLNARD